MLVFLVTFSSPVGGTKLTEDINVLVASLPLSETWKPNLSASLSAQPQGMSAVTELSDFPNPNWTDMEVRAAGGSCDSNNCKPGTGTPGAAGCAQCAVIRVNVPLNARITSVEFYASSGSPNDGPLSIMQPGTDRAWDHYDGWAEDSSGSYKTVWGVYHNRSENRIRHIRLTVRYS